MVREVALQAAAEGEGAEGECRVREQEEGMEGWGWMVVSSWLGGVQSDNGPALLLSL